MSENTHNRHPERSEEPIEEILLEVLRCAQDDGCFAQDDGGLYSDEVEQIKKE